MYERIFGAWIALCVLLGVTAWRNYSRFQELNKQYAVKFDTSSFNRVQHAMDISMITTLAFFVVVTIGACGFIIHYFGTADPDEKTEDEDPDPSTPMDATWDEDRAA